MAIQAFSQIQIISLFILLSCLVRVSHESRAPPHHLNFRVRAVSLGGWLVTEGWIKPSLFDAIPNKDLLDGTELRFKSVKGRKYLAAKNGGGGAMTVAKKTIASTWGTFKLWRISETRFNFRVLNKQFVGLDKSAGGKGRSTKLVAVAPTPGSSETFEIVRKSDDSHRVRIKAPNGFFLQEHWKTFIVENDFEFISRNGLNTVRIPVGWWIASDPTPPKPFVGGSLQALDNAFSWAQKYGLKVIIDLHGAPGSQNGWEHSGSRDSFIEWGQTDETIQQTVAVIDFLAARYAKSPCLLGIELLNEPLAPHVSLKTVVKFSKAGYAAVRKHTSSAYVILSNRIATPNVTELIPLGRSLAKSVIDIHYYSVFNDFFNTYTVKQNIDFIKTNRSRELTQITTSNGPLTLVGEWVAEWKVKRASKEDYKKFAAAQLEVFGKATFGWAYWTLKNAEKHWSLEWMIKNGYIQL